jgi:hypothetical protein
MSKYTLLYYPDFHPDPVWLRRVLLLADDVKRIVPTDVELRDPDALIALQDSIPGCLSEISPKQSDVAIENDNLPRIAKAFALLAQSRGRRAKKRATIEFSTDGSLSVIGHVFLHNAKLSPLIREELRRNKLIIDELGSLSDRKGFLVVDEAASDLILSGIAENISRRTGLDAITDKPIPFALNALNALGVARTGTAGGAEGAVLAALASVLVPTAVSTLKPKDYRNLRESYAPIRGAFKELTANLAQINRLNRIGDPKRLKDQIEVTAQEFLREYRLFRKSKYTRSFKRWAPLYVGGLLSVITTAVSPPVGLVLATASLGIQIIERKLEGSADQPMRERTFNMVAGLRKDIIRRSGIKELI